MEKNTLIAIVLSMLVLVLWSVMFSPQKKEQAPAKVEAPAEQKAVQQAPSQQAPSQQASSQAQTIAKEAAPAAAPAKVQQPAQVKKSRDVVVDTELYRAVFSERLAALKSFELKKYHTTAAAGSPPLQMNKEDRPNIYLSLYRNSVPGLDQAVFEADKLNLDLTRGSNPGSVIFRWTSPAGISFIRTYTFQPDSYEFKTDLTVENRSQQVFDDNVEMNMVGAPFEPEGGYYKIHGMVALSNDKLEDKDTKKVEKPESLPGDYKWVGYQDNYFLEALIPWESLKTSVKLETVQKDVLKLTLVNPPLKLEPMQKAALDYKVFLGPKDLSVLKPLGSDLARVVNFGWFDIIGKPLLSFLKFIYKYVHNYGVAIIILTILIKILFWPLTQKSYSSMKSMQKLQPQMAKIREKYKDNKEKLNQEMMALYKSNKVNPFGGCLPMLIQIPVFFALYRVLGGSIAIRHAPFMLWINDLSAPDRLNIGIHIPYTGGLPVLTLLMGVSMFIQQKMTPTAGDPTQAKIMLMMPIVFTFMFINFPAGLVLYWLVNNILTIGQQYLINRK